LRAALGDETPLEPHVTLAYANRGTDADGLERVLEACGDRVIETVVDHVALLRLHRRERGYEWAVLERAALGGRR
jgi:2'-5' RNA ligase